MELLDNFLDKITMYRLMLYYLLLLLFVALVFSTLGILHFNPLLLLFSAAFLVIVCWLTNKLFALTFAAPTNVESVYISAIILALIIPPIHSFNGIIFLFWAAVLAMASKYILAIGKKHIFNPVAIAVALTSLALIGSASWWIGTLPMLPFVLLGLVIVRKLRRYDLVLYFFIASLLTMLLLDFTQKENVMLTLQSIFFSSPLFFFAFVMLSEPLTTPLTKKSQIFYGAIIGVLSTPRFHLGAYYTTPEIALIIGNLFSYIVSPKIKLVATILEKRQISSDIFDFLFTPEKKLIFVPGQYMEWTFQHPHTDSRGNRRFFTIASSPTEETLRLGIRFYPNGSSYKKALFALPEHAQIVGSQLSGDFTLPKDKQQKLVFIAGGIGVTPFRSMIRYLLDTKEQRSIIMFYANKQATEIAYTDVFNQAQQQLGIKIIYTLTDQTNVPTDWQGKIGRIDAAMIQQEVPDFHEREFYLSGPHAMVVSYEEILRSMGVKRKQIKKDYFPGLV